MRRPERSKKTGVWGRVPQEVYDLLFSQGSYGAVPETARRAKREKGRLGKEGPMYDD
jgi:hypothetical protein